MVVAVDDVVALADDVDVVSDDAVAVALADAVVDTVRIDEGVPVGLTECDLCAVVDELKVALPDRVDELVPEDVAVTELEPVELDVISGDKRLFSLGVGLEIADADDVEDDVAAFVNTAMEGDAVEVADGLLDADVVSVDVVETEDELVDETEPELEVVAVDEADTDAVPDDDAVAVAVGEFVEVDVVVAVDVAPDVIEDVAVAEDVADAVLEFVEVDDDVGDAECVAVVDTEFD